MGYRAAMASVTRKALVPVTSDTDILTARQQGKALAAEAGFSLSDLTLIMTAISELARNIVTYAKQGEVELSLVEQGKERGIVVVARDEGPGIADIDLAMTDGYSSMNSLGLGLPGARRLMDDFQIVSKPGQGTTVTAKKWRR